MIKHILLTLLVITSTSTVLASETTSPEVHRDASRSTLSECIASTMSKAQLFECVKGRDATQDTDDDHKVLKCLINGNDKRIYWYEDCING